MFEKSETYRDLSLARHGPKTNRITCISGNSTGSRIAYSRDDCSLRGYLLRGKLLASPFCIEKAHALPVTGISWGLRSDLHLVTVACDQYIKVWKVRSQSISCSKVITVIKDWDSSSDICLEHVAFSNDGLRLIATDRDSTVMMFDALSFAKLAEFRITTPILDFQWFHSGSEHVMFALQNGDVQIFRIGEGRDIKKKLHFELSQTIGGHCSTATCVAMDREGQRICIGTDEGLVSVFDSKSLLCTSVISDVDDRVTWVIPSYNGALVTVGYELAAARIYNGFSGKLICDVPESQSGVGTKPCGYWLPHANLFVYASSDSTGLSVYTENKQASGKTEPPETNTAPLEEVTRSQPRGVGGHRSDARDRHRIHKRDDRRDGRGYGRKNFRRDDKRF